MKNNSKALAQNTSTERNDLEQDQVCFASRHKTK